MGHHDVERPGRVLQVPGVHAQAIDIALGLHGVAERNHEGLDVAIEDVPGLGEGGAVLRLGEERTRHLRRLEGQVDETESVEHHAEHGEAVSRLVGDPVGLGGADERAGQQREDLGHAQVRRRHDALANPLGDEDLGCRRSLQLEDVELAQHRDDRTHLALDRRGIREGPAELGQELHPEGHGLAELLVPHEPMQADLSSQDDVERRPGVLDRHPNELVHDPHVAVEPCRPGRLHVQRARALVVVLPLPLVEERQRLAVVLVGGLESGGPGGSARGAEVQVLQLRGIGHQRGLEIDASVQMLDELEETGFALPVVGVLEQELGHLAVTRGHLEGGAQTPSRLLHAVVGKAETNALEADVCRRPVLVGHGHYEVVGERRSQALEHRAPVGTEEMGQGRQVEIGPHAGSALEAGQGAFREVPELGGDERDHVGGGGPGTSRLGIVGPATGPRVEGEGPLVVHGLEEMAQEERVSPGALVAQDGEPDPPITRPEGRVDHGQHRVLVEGADLHLVEGGLRVSELLDDHAQRVAGLHLVRAVAADEEHVAVVRSADQARQQLEGRPIRPLEIVQEDDQGPVGPRHGVEQASNGVVESVAGFHRRRPARSMASRVEHVGELGNELREHLGHLDGKVPEALPPGDHRRLVSGRDEAHQLAQRLDQAGVGSAPVELVELAVDEEDAAVGQPPPRLLDQGGLASAGVAPEEHDP